MSDQEKIEKLRDALAGAVGAIETLSEIVRQQGYPSTADKAMQFAAGYLQTLKDT